VPRVAVLLAILLLGLAAPAVAAAQLGPQNVPPSLAEPEEEEQVQAEEDTGLTTRQLVLIFGAAVGVLALTAWFIMRDARGAAPASERGRASSAAGVPETPATAKKSARERERERARKRNKAKAVRNQRKRNRPR
jgi:hypothetical protein